MDMKLGENIRNFRKEHMLTQEQLAEALGVTVGAVYKWETRRSTPEVGLIMEMADLFETSVDVLLGYELRNNDREHIVERLKAYVHDKSATDALAEAEKALKKYPNNFDIVYHCARLYHVRGTDLQDRKLLYRALELLQHACLLIDQNTDDSISVLSIQIQMAEIYPVLDENEKAVELLKRNNPCRMNSALIGAILTSSSDKAEEALPYLSEALLDSVVNQIRIATGYLNIYIKKGDYQSALDILQWALSMFPGLKSPGKTSFLNKTEAVFLALCADMHLRLEQRAQAREYLCQAKTVAQQFDAQPNYNTDNIRFVIPDGRSSAYDNLGTTAMNGIQNIVDEEEYPAFTDLWEEVKNEAV